MKRILIAALLLAWVSATLTGCVSVSLIRHPAKHTEETSTTQALDYRAGSRLRLYTHSLPAPIIGTLTSLKPDSLVVVNDYGAELHLPRWSISDAYISHGRLNKADRSENDAASAMVVGAIIGGAVGWYLSDSGDIGGSDSNLGVALRWGGIAGLGCGITGAVVGSSEHKEVWKPVPKVSITIPIE